MLSGSQFCDGQKYGLCNTNQIKADYNYSYNGNRLDQTSYNGCRAKHKLVTMDVLVDHTRPVIIDVDHTKPDQTSYNGCKTYNQLQ